MLTRAAERVADHTKRIVQLELELATLELKRKLGTLGAGIGLVVGGAIVAFFALGFTFATVAAAFATFLPTWLAILIVAGGLFLLAGGLIAIGVSALKRSTPPIPELALQEVRLTTEALKNGSG